MSNPTGWRLGCDPAPLLAQVRGSDQEIADLLGVEIKTVMRWRLGRCRMSVGVADRCAIAIGLHASSLWPDRFGVDAYFYVRPSQQKRVLIQNPRYDRQDATR